MIDLAGVLHVGNEAVPGAAEALTRLRAAGLSVRFVTNTTRRTRARLSADLQAMGFELETAEIVTAASAARAYIRDHGLHPHRLIHPGIDEEFADLDTAEPDCVLLGDAAHGFTYDALDRCFGVLIEDRTRPLIAMARNRYFRDADGLHLDMGAFVAALEMASERKAIVTGKPSPDFFGAVLAELGLEPADALMIGDDVEADIGGALDCGIAAMLVRTGKFRSGDEQRASALGADTAADFSAAVDSILDQA